MTRILLAVLLSLIAPIIFASADHDPDKWNGSIRRRRQEDEEKEKLPPLDESTLGGMIAPSRDTFVLNENPNETNVKNELDDLYKDFQIHRALDRYFEEMSMTDCTTVPHDESKGSKSSKSSKKSKCEYYFEVTSMFILYKTLTIAMAFSCLTT